jgi:hypothetical protein
MNAKPSSPKGRPAPQMASRAPHRKINQAQERQDAPTLRPGTREVDPTGAAGPGRLRHSNTDGCPPAGCPIATDINQVLNLSEDLSRAMRQLRRKLDACEKCPLDDPPQNGDFHRCGFRQAFQERVRAAIQEVTGEWGIP